MSYVTAHILRVWAERCDKLAAEVSEEAKCQFHGETDDGKT